MPTYEYECQKCGYHFELFQRITEAARKTCPECKGKVKRLIGTGAGIIFKGSGFYATDYRSADYNQKAKKEKEKGEKVEKGDKKADKGKDTESKDSK